MAYFIRTVSRIHSYVPARTIFSSSGIGIDNFKLAREQHLANHAQSMSSFKKRFLESIENSNAQIFTEDLRNMIMSAETDQDINAVITALKKYTLNKLKFTDYHFGSPIMRMLYIQNKPDLAMKIFMDENFKDIFRDSGSALILLNKLVEDKRYDDAVKIFEYGIQRGFNTTSGRAYPTDVVMLAIEGLYRQNTKQSLEKAKELVSKVMERDSDINPRTASMLALLAIEQNEPAFAMEVLGAVRAQNLTTIQNIRAICYAEMSRVEEAINVVHLLADQPPIDNDRRRVFPLVLKRIEKAVEKSKEPELQSRFNDLSKFVTTNNRLSTVDLVEFINEPVNRRSATLPNRQGARQESPTGFQRNTNFRGGFNQQSNRSGNAYINNERRSFNSRQEKPLAPPPRPQQRSSEAKLGPMTTTSTSPIPQYSSRSNASSKSNKRDERQEQSAWNPDSDRSS